MMIIRVNPVWILILAILIVVGSGISYAYYYYRVAEHVLFQSSDQSSRLDIALTCKYGGGQTYYAYVVLRMRDGREVSRAEICCGKENITSCRNEYKNVRALTFDHQNKVVGIDFSSRPSMKIPVSFSTSYELTQRFQQRSVTAPRLALLTRAAYFARTPL